jgi:hypothetical protein
VVDGKFSDGTAYYSLLSISNVVSGAQATCTLATFGLPLSRFAVTAPRTLPAFTSILNLTQGTDPFASGYATLSCTQPVQASLMYVEFAPNGAILGMATVLSAPPIHYAANFMITGAGLKYGVAIANTNSTPITVTIALNLPNGTATTRNIQIAAQSRFVGFVDDILTVPSTPGLVYFEVGSTGLPFNATALLYAGPVFTTLVPATEP